MSKKRTVYSTEFKSKLVLELLKNEKTVAEIASANNSGLKSNSTKNSTSINSDSF